MRTQSPMRQVFSSCRAMPPHRLPRVACAEKASAPLSTVEIVMIPASWTQTDAGPDRPPPVLPVLTRRVRLAIVVVVVGLVTMFATAAWLDPYV